ncbi:MULTISPECIES: DUF7689 domain-containing protein [Sphingobacterium]|uniref:DUF7689 domain-containing protein n=1 Tax=Sphingobacterium TaxID=28453 RepID=UPI00257E694F|nr:MULTISPECIES: hypothetical protein [Sphingobacterium]
MKTDKKLSFEELEKELSLEHSPFERLELLSEINGGRGGTVDDYIVYFQSLGFKMTIDSDGNYHYNAGYGPSIIPGNYSMSYQNMYGSYFNFNPWVNLNSGGWVIYAPPFYGYSGIDPWLKDSSGHIIAYATGYHTYNNGAGYDATLMMDEYLLTAGGYQFKLYKVDQVYDTNMGGFRVPTPKEKYNCFGYAAGLDEYWFADNHGTPEDEALQFNQYINMFYEECYESESSIVVFYNNSTMTSPVHAAVRNSNGQYSWKAGGFNFEENQDYSVLFDRYHTAAGEKFYRLKTN